MGKMKRNGLRCAQKQRNRCDFANCLNIVHLRSYVIQTAQLIRYGLSISGVLLQKSRSF
jgi:hypothetical protein